MRSRILFIPSIQDMGSFGVLAAHIGHYLGHVGPERLTIPIDEAIIDQAEAWLKDPVLPAGFDRAVEARVANVAEIMDLRPWPSTLEVPALSVDAIVDWNVARSDLQPWRKLKGKFRRHLRAYTVDWSGTRLGASWFAELAKVLGSGRAYAGVGTELLSEFIESKESVDLAYLVGTGPSAREALKHDLSDGVRIVCNTIVLDDELMAHVKPDLLTFADPIFHFGPSTYAHEFQRAMARQAKQYDFLVVTTERFAPLLAAHAPDIADRIVGLRQGTSAWPGNLNIRRHPAVRPYPNILTMLMLPLAASVAHTVRLMGFDGRSPHDVAFWSHGETVQFDREMAEIHQVHPGFFEVDYEDYYETHVSQVELILRNMELRGIEATTLTDSYMAPLRRRQPASANLAGEAAAGELLLVSVTPDWLDDFGHFGPFERRLHVAADASGLKHLALASTGLSPEEEWQIPTFTGFGSSVVRGGGQFGPELKTALAALDPPPGSVVAMYAGDAWHLPAFIDAASQRPNVTFVLNLMKSHAWIRSALQGGNAWATSLSSLLQDCLELARGTNCHVTVDTQQLRDDLVLLGCSGMEVWPMASVWPVRDSPAPSGPTSPIQVVSPVHAHINKGIEDVAGLSVRVGERIARGELSFIARSAPQPTPVSGKIQAACDQLVENGVHLERRNLSDAEYAEFVTAADIILIPYKKDPFRTRTSGVVLDALLAGKPVLATRGTWAGEVVEQFRVGVTYEEGNIAEMVSALEFLVDNLAEFRSRVAEARGAIEWQFSPDRTLEFLTSRPAATAEISGDEVPRVIRQGGLLRSLFEDRTIRADDAKVDLAVLRDTRTRIEQNRGDEIATLRSAREWARRQPMRPPRAREPLSAIDFRRESHARLDEVALVASVVDPQGSRAGVMVDVGAHRGSAFSHFLRRNWRIFAFEPDVRHVEYLDEKFGDDERVLIDQRAVANHSGESLPFFVSPESTGVSGLTPFLESHTQQSTVETVALKDVLEGRHVGVLKVDTEGYEMRVLEGYPWESDSPDVIVCEYEDRKTRVLGYTTKDLCDFLQERGYQVWVSEWHPIIRYGISHDWRRMTLYNGEPPPSDGWGNLIAFKRHRSRNSMAAYVESIVQVGDDQDGVPVTDESTRTQSRSAGSPGSRLRRARTSLRGVLGGLVGAALAAILSTILLVVTGFTTAAIATATAGLVAVVGAVVLTAMRVDRLDSRSPSGQSRKTDT